MEQTTEEEAGNMMNCVGGKWIIWRNRVVAATTQQSPAAREGGGHSGDVD